MVQSSSLTLVSHRLCPYVQRAVISLLEKKAPFERVTIDLANRPDWFKTLSPLGKVPLLKVDDAVIFESAVILEYLEETQNHPLHPQAPLLRAQHRSWIEFGSSILNDIAGLYLAPDQAAFDMKRTQLGEKFTRVENILGDGPWFSGADFCLVDAVYGPIFRYFDTFDLIEDFKILKGKPKLADWRMALAARPSVASAVDPEYGTNLWNFLLARNSYLSDLMRAKTARPS